MIEVSGVTKRYGGVAVVDDVSLSIPDGGVVALIGPNGAGKSTLLSVVSRLLAPDSGTVRVDGLDVSRTPGDTLARRLAILRQDSQVGSRLTVRDLVTFGRYPHSKGRYTVDDRAHVERALAFLDITELAGRFLDELSGGQRQRAFVAMVLCQDTDHVLLDEPLNNLDLRHSVALMRLVRRVADELSKTVVIVLHDVNVASCWADRIVAMKDGRVAYDGPPAEVMRPEVLGDLYDLDVAVHQLDGQLIGTYYR
jgi:iron complex transport system ATP-binding protein